MDLANEETQSQQVLSALLIILTAGLLILALVECLWEIRRLSGGSREEDRDAHVFLRRRDLKPKESGASDDKYKTGGALYAPKLLDVPANRVNRSFSRWVWLGGRLVDWSVDPRTKVCSVCRCAV